MLDGPIAHERDNGPNPFTDFAIKVRFAHGSGEPSRVIPGYFAADGRTIESSAAAGTVRRAHRPAGVISRSEKTAWVSTTRRPTVPVG